jgi:hypothetical protein
MPSPQLLCLRLDIFTSINEHLPKNDIKPAKQAEPTIAPILVL